MVVTVTFLDGVMVQGRSWGEAESNLRASQHDPSPTRHKWRADMRHRCKVWTGGPVQLLDTLTSQRFLRQLEASGLCRVDVEK